MEGLSYIGGGAPITRLKKCFKTNCTTVLINFKIYWPFYASKRHRLFWVGGFITGCIFCLQVQ